MYDDHGSRYLYLAINDHNNNTFDTYTSVFNSSILNKNILARISLKTPFSYFKRNRYTSSNRA